MFIPLIAWALAVFKHIAIHILRNQRKSTIQRQSVLCWYAFAWSTIWCVWHRTFPFIIVRRNWRELDRVHRRQEDRLVKRRAIVLNVHQRHQSESDEYEGLRREKHNSFCKVLELWCRRFSLFGIFCWKFVMLIIKNILIWIRKLLELTPISPYA